jgi:uncharacterized membrane protein
MTDPRTPADALGRAAENMRHQKEAMRNLSAEIAQNTADLQAAQQEQEQEQGR